MWSCGFWKREPLGLRCEPLVLRCGGRSAAAFASLRSMSCTVSGPMALTVSESTLLAVSASTSCTVSEPNECRLRILEWARCRSCSPSASGPTLRLRVRCSFGRCSVLRPGPGYAYGALGLLPGALGLRCFQTISAASSRAASYSRSSALSSSVSTTAPLSADASCLCGGCTSALPAVSPGCALEPASAVPLRCSASNDGMSCTSAPSRLDHVLKCAGGGRDPVGRDPRTERANSPERTGLAGLAGRRSRRWLSTQHTLACLLFTAPPTHTTNPLNPRHTHLQRRDIRARTRRASALLNPQRRLHRAATAAAAAAAVISPCLPPINQANAPTPRIRIEEENRKITAHTISSRAKSSSKSVCSTATYRGSKHTAACYERCWSRP